MLHLNFDPFPVLTTDRLVLRQMTDDDTDEIFYMRSDEQVMRLIARPRAKTKDDARAFIKIVNENVAKNEGITWAMSLNGSPTLIGTIGIWRIIKEHHRGEVGYTLHPAHHRQGLMHEALTEVINYGFNVLGLHSLEGGVNPENTASIKVLERCHFVREAYFKQDFFYEGTFRDSAIYSLISPKK